MKNTTIQTDLARRIKQFPAWCVVKVIRGYQCFISPMIGPTCRFYPSCSQYALTAVSEHGVLKGTWFAVCRICKCHPLHPGGVDFVPGTAPEQCKIAHEQS